MRADAAAVVVQKEMAAKAELEARLVKMEARVLHGGENLVDKVTTLEQQGKDVEAQLEVQRCGASSASL